MSTSASEPALVERALAGDRAAFDELAEPYRRELHIHCYRMLASLHEAEDLVQESLLRAWRGLRTYRGRGPVRAWLYKIATNTCLNHLRRRPRIVVPGHAERSGKPSVMDIPWLEPFPDALPEAADPLADPAERVAARATTSLAFLCAVQMLPAVQRAVLILRDVLEFPAKEVAAILETTPTAVHSALRRARARLSPDIRTEPPLAARPADAEEEMLVRRFVRAWEAADIPTLVELLAKDATLAMPPTPIWFRGRKAIGEFLATVPADGRLDQIPLVRTRANGSPAVAAYMPEEGDGDTHCAYGVMVLTLKRGAIGAITGFADPDLFRLFELPKAITPAMARTRARGRP